MEKTPIKDLINRWDTRAHLAAAIGASVAAVHKWAEADRIPAKWQAAVIRAAQAQGFSEVTADWMVDAHARQGRAA